MAESILVVEDDRKIGGVVKAYLEGAGYRVRLAGTGRDALRMVEEEPPDLAVLDIGLPDTDGDILCREIREYGEIPFIFLTSRATEEERLAGFALGADDYVVKPFSPRELVFRVKALFKRLGGRGGGGALLSFNGGALTLDPDTMGVTVGGEPVPCTSTEFRLLHLMASAPGKVFSRDELVSRGLGYQFEGYERSVDAHVKNIRKKLGDDPRTPHWIQTVYGVGYRFGGKRD